MKKITLVGLLLFISLFAHTSKMQSLKQKDGLNKNQPNKNELLIKSSPNRLKKYAKPIKSTSNNTRKQQPAKHFSRNRKGKLTI
jgi:hypothetical protein